MCGLPDEEIGDCHKLKKKFSIRNRFVLCIQGEHLVTFFCIGKSLFLSFFNFQNLESNFYDLINFDDLYYNISLTYQVCLTVYALYYTKN